MSFVFSGDEPKRDILRFGTNKNGEYVKCVGFRATVTTCEHQLPFVQQTSVGDQIVQSDGLQEMFQTLKHKQPPTSDLSS